MLDCLRETRPPSSPEQVCADFAATLRAYGLHAATADRWGGQFPVEALRKYGITLEPSAKPKSDLYKDLLPLINSGRVALLDHARLIAQLAQLERPTSRGGRDTITHPPHGHDDCANAAAGALAECRYIAAPCRVFFLPAPSAGAQFAARFRVSQAARRDEAVRLFRRRWVSSE